MFPVILALWLTHAASEAELRQAVAQGTGVIELPAGITTLARPLEIPRGAKGLELRGHPSGSTLRMAPGFRGPAAIVADGASGLLLTGFTIAGNRKSLASDLYLPPSNVAFADFYPDNGILLRRCRDATIRGVALRRIRGFPILASACARLEVEEVAIEDSGTLDGKGRNNTTGGILIEEGTAGFAVRRCTLSRVLGNGIWTHSNYTSARNQDGLIAGNTLHTLSRSAIQVGHATRVRVEGSRGDSIGYPPRYVDAEPVALDTAGNVDRSVYIDNRFTDINGHCIDLDGFHDGEVRGNSCVNRKPAAAYPNLHFGIIFGNNNPDMASEGVVVEGNLIEGFAFGGIYLIGSGHRIAGNRFLDLNRNHCTGDATRPGCNYAADQPGMLRSGIYLGNFGGRPAQTHGNVVRGNVFSGFGMDRWCVGAAPGVDRARNTIENNRCTAPGR